MLEIVKKTLLAGIGLTLKTKDEIEGLAKELIKRGEMTEQEGRSFLEDMMSRYDETVGKLEERVEKSVKEFLKKANVVTGDELKSLKKEIRDIKMAISQEKKDNG